MNALKSFVRASSGTLLALSLSVAACSHSEPPPVIVPPPAPAPEPPPAPAPTPPPAATAPAAAELQGNQIQINQVVEFRENSEELHEHSHEILDRVAELLHAHAEIHHIRIEGNTDDLGTAEYNMHLSEGRARSVIAYLHEHGVTIQMDPVGHGSTQPLCHEDTNECRLRNRRVDFIVVP